MGDKRTDSGQFYPGGKVIPRQPVRPGGGSDADAVHYYAETRTDEQKAQARQNMNAMDADTRIPDVLGKLPMRPLPKYLHYLAFDDTYPADAAWLYAQLGPSELGRCSAVRRGGKLWRNYDWTFDDAAEFVVKVCCSSSRFGSVGVASVGSRLTENDVMSAVNSRYYKCLPGMTLDGINEKGVVCEINVDGGPKTGWHGDAELEGIHILAAVRWVLDHGETAQQAAEWIADRIIQPQGEMNFHFMVADATSTYIVENGEAHLVPSSLLEGAVLTNYALYDEAHAGGGKERYALLAGGTDISAVNFTNAYQSGNDWDSDFESAAQHAAAIEQWAAQGTDKEAHRGKTTSSGNAWWQSVHTTEYDFEAKTMKIAVQEVDDWYTFAVDQANVDLAPIEAQLAALQDGKADEFTEWGDFIASAGADDALEGANPTVRFLPEMSVWIIEGLANGWLLDFPVSGSEDDIDIEFQISGGGENGTVTATRRRVLRTGDAPTPQELMNAISTNNPAFVSAVRNTPTSGMPEDMPTDWGTYGTVGAALAALAAFVKWAKAKIVAVIGDDGKPTDDFATDLLGKDGAKEKVEEIIANKVLPVTGDSSLTKTIATICGKAIKAPEGGGGGNGFFVVMSDYNDVNSGGASLTVGDLMFGQNGTKRSIKKLPNTEILEEGNKKFEPFAVPIPASGTVELADAHGGYVLKNNVEVPTGTCSVADGDVFLLHGCFCLPFDTPILMSDGSMRRICDIRVGDLVMSINPETGAREADCVVFCDGLEDKRHGVKDVWHFDDGSVIETVHRHRIYNVDLDEPMYMEAWNVGERCYRDDGSTPRLVSHERLHGDWRHCTIFTKKWNNYFANGILCGNRNSSKLTVGV